MILSIVGSVAFTDEHLRLNMIKLRLLLLLSSFACLSGCLAASMGAQPDRRQSAGAGGGGDLDHFIYPTWSVLNLSSACSPAGCILTLHLSSAATASEPAISAACDINGNEHNWQPCTTLAEITTDFINNNDDDDDDDEDSAIWALPLPAVDSFALSIQHRFSNASLTPTRYYNVTGNLTVDYELVKWPVNLTVLGTRVSEMWSWTRVRHIP